MHVIEVTNPREYSCCIIVLETDINLLIQWMYSGCIIIVIIQFIQFDTSYCWLNRKKRDVHVFGFCALVSSQKRSKAISAFTFLSTPWTLAFLRFLVLKANEPFFLWTIRKHLNIFRNSSVCSSLAETRWQKFKWIYPHINPHWTNDRFDSIHLSVKNDLTRER